MREDIVSLVYKAHFLIHLLKLKNDDPIKKV